MSSKIKPAKGQKHLYCAVCMTMFVSRQSMRKHILKKRHTMTNCSTLPDFLKDLLPPERTLISKVQKLENGFTAEIYLPTIGTRESLHKWVDAFMQINNCTYVRSRASKNATNSIIVQEHYQCEHHSTPNPVKRKKVSKGTNCRSTIYTVLKKSLQNLSWVNINFIHNHPINSPELLRFKKPTEDIKQIFIRMFEDGASPADALRYFKIHVRMQLSEKEYNQYSNDRSKVPDYDWVRHFYHKTVKKKYVAVRSPEILKSVQQTVESKNCKNLFCSLTELDNNNFFIVIITPIMKRLLQTKQAGDIIFIDNCGSVDRFGLKVFLLFTKLHSSEAPVGVIITTQDATRTLIQAFNAFLTAVGPHAFGSQGKKGPYVVLTDDNPTEISAVRSAFLSSNDFLCVPHFLRACHRWLLKPKNEVHTNDRKTIYSIVRQMVYATDERAFSDHFTNLTQNFETHIPVKRFAKQIFEKRKKWAHCFRTDPILKNSDTNCIVDFQLRILKEQILEKIKNQSPSQLVEFFTSEFSDFYKQKFIDCCLGNIRCFKTEELTKDDLSNYFIIQVSDSLFVVYSKIKNIKYMVNSDIGICTCYIGVSGNFCKHQQLLSRNKKAFYSYLEGPKDEESKTVLHYIATGYVNVHEDLNCTNMEEASIEQYGIIEEVTEEIINYEDWEVVEESVSETHFNDPLTELDNHINDICKEIKLYKNYYLDGLTNLNLQLSSIKDNPTAILKAMYSFNSDEAV